MYKVLIVDDKDIVRRELKRLKIWGDTSGFTIEAEAQNGQEALDYLAINPVDLIITDIKMPKVDGIELLRAIVEDKLCSCVVLLSDYSDFTYARQGIILGAFDYMPKPVNENELFNLLIRAREYLDNQQKEKDRVKKLEDMQTEKKESYLSIPEIKRLAGLIITRDQDTYEFTSQLVNKLYDHTEADVKAFDVAIHKVLSELMNELYQEYPWMDKFLDLKELQSFHYQTEKECASIKDIFLDRIKGLIQLFGVVRCDAAEKGIVGQVCNYILEHVEQDISLAKVADSLYMNKTYISELFKQKMGIAFTEYVTGVKMERAKLLISQDKLKAYEIAEQLGFKDTEYFSKVFKKSTGMTPTEFRKK